MMPLQLELAFEGPTSDPHQSLCAIAKAQSLATLLLSLGLPMLLAGDEIGRTQRAKTTRLCRTMDLVVRWEHIRPETRIFAVFFSYLIIPPQASRISRPRFLRGEVLSEAGVKDITWGHPVGYEAPTQLGKPVHFTGYVLSGRRGEFFTPGGQRDIDEAFCDNERILEDIDFHSVARGAYVLGPPSIPHNQQGMPRKPGFMRPERFSAAGSFICALYRSCTATELPQEISSRRAGRAEDVNPGRF